MKMKSTFMLLTIILTHFSLMGQGKIVNISFDVLINKSTLQIGKEYNIQQNKISVNVLRFFISNIELYQNENKVFFEESSFHLIDIKEANSKSLSFVLPENIVYNKIKFALGIDSTINVSGVMDGDLDPVYGMYWTWQSGYINFKMEGRCSECPAPKNDFEFHIGGYQYPFNAFQEIVLDLKKNNPIKIKMELFDILGSTDFKTTHRIMQPNKEALDFSNKLKHAFSIQGK